MVNGLLLGLHLVCDAFYFPTHGARCMGLPPPVDGFFFGHLPAIIIVGRVDNIDHLSVGKVPVFSVVIRYNRSRHGMEVGRTVGNRYR